SALEHADGLRDGDLKAANAAREQLDALARQFEGDAGSASGADAARMKSLAETLKGRALRLR
ncbi:MAG TPA: hypothetical protein VKE51_28785, partial [Vicinamibacterales bacterium]|nr:hypothetical protein [Vicinamibacterales bacterium]